MDALRFAAILLLAALVAATSGNPRSQTESWLSRYDLSSSAAESVRLPSALGEVSGLAVDERGRLFAHDDERARIYRIDPDGGDALSSFTVGGRLGMRGDFEGLAVVGERFFLSTSDGTLVEFAETGDGGIAESRTFRTRLGRVCELEGLAYDSTTDALLLPCKTARDPVAKEHLVVFALRLSTMALEPYPRVRLSHGVLARWNLEEGFHPSALEVHPVSGHMFVLAAQEEALIELDRDGRLLSGRSLSSRVHPQPEGLAFSRDLDLLVADEGDGRLTRYRLAHGSHASGAEPVSDRNRR